MHPQLSEDNQLTLKMTVAGDSRDRAIELARRMEETRRFTQTSIDEEDHLINAGDNIQLVINAIYIPGTDLPEPQPASDKPAKSTKSAAAAKSVKPAKASKPAPKFMAQPTGRRKP